LNQALHFVNQFHLFMLISTHLSHIHSSLHCVSKKKVPTFELPVTLSNLNRFSKKNVGIRVSPSELQLYSLSYYSST